MFRLYKKVLLKNVNVSSVFESIVWYCKLFT